MLNYRKFREHQDHQVVYQEPASFVAGPLQPWTMEALYHGTYQTILAHLAALGPGMKEFLRTSGGECAQMFALKKFRG